MAGERIHRRRQSAVRRRRSGRLSVASVPGPRGATGFIDGTTNWLTFLDGPRAQPAIEGSGRGRRCAVPVAPWQTVVEAQARAESRLLPPGRGSGDEGKRILGPMSETFRLCEPPPGAPLFMLIRAPTTLPCRALVPDRVVDAICPPENWPRPCKRKS